MKNKLLFNLIVLLSLSVVHTLLFLWPSNSMSVYFNIIRPVAILVLLSVSFIFIGTSFGFSKQKKPALLIMLMGIVLYCFLLFLAGLITGLGKNAMFTDASIFLKNIWQYVPFVMGSEIIRFQLMKNADKKYKVLMMIAITFVFSFIMLENINNAINFGLAGQIDYIMTIILPIIVVNFFLTFICTSGSLLGVVCFRSAFSFIPIFMPYLPNITKLFSSILIYSVIFIMFILYDKFIYDTENKHKLKTKPYSWKAYIVPALLLVLLVGMGLNLMPIMPVAVASNSMKSSFARGSVVFVKQLDEESAVKTLKIGDIIQFRTKNMSIIHRIIEINNDFRGEIQYVTKGDNNTAIDIYPVKPEQVVGVAKGSLPFLGYPSVLLMEILK